jgi:hypothetical protein
MEAKPALAILFSSMLGSVSLCCGLLNLVLRPNVFWSAYVIGAALMLWLWLVPPLLRRGLSTLVQLIIDTGAVALYVLLIALNLDGLHWYVQLALPIIALLGALLLFLGLTLRDGQHSLLVSAALVIGAIGAFLVGLEIFSDLYFYGTWSPTWSLVAIIVALAMEIPLIVIRAVPALREEVRRRFHM